MNRTLTTAAAAVLLMGLAACSSSDPKPAGATKSAAAAASKPLTASAAFTKIGSAVTSARLSGTVTAENDPNKLLGRPGQYTSKVTFSDSRIAASDVAGTKKGDVERGGSVEVFATAADASARAKYIETIGKSMSALAEYDYVHGTVLVRVSHYLTPAQAASYKTAAARLS